MCDNVDERDTVMWYASQARESYPISVSESLFKVGICLPASPHVTDDDVRYVVDTIKEAIEP